MCVKLLFSWVVFSPYSWPFELFLRIWSKVPRVRGGDFSGAAHGKLRGYFSMQLKNFVTISSKYDIYILLLSNEWCLNLLIHLEGLMNRPSLLKLGIRFFIKMAQLPYIAYYSSNQFRSENKHPLKSNFRWGQFYDLNWSDPYWARYCNFTDLYFQGVKWGISY